jgi:hypothetical protein
MNLLLKIAIIYIPPFLKRRELMKLFHLTASTFEKPIPPMADLSFEECLAEFAHFTKSEVDQLIIRHEDLQTVQDRLFQGAYAFGDKFRRIFRVSSTSDVIAVSRLLYRVLGIDFQGTEQGTIKISKCFFSKIYSSTTCHVISSLDAGMIAGLSGGNEMIFSERITEGAESCIAQFILKEQFQ